MSSVRCRLRGWATILVAPFATALFYAPTLGFDFIGWDDGAYVTLNDNLTSTEGLARIWFSADNEQYYPLTFTSYWLEYRLWGLNPAGYHATNILLHALSVLLLVILLRIFGFSPRATIFIALFFGLHPVQVMSVAWVSARKNLLSGALVLVATILWINYRRTTRIRWGAGAVVMFACALLSKTAVALVPLAWFTLDLSYLNVPMRRAARATVGLLVISGLAVLATWVFEQKFLGTLPGLGDRLLIGARAILFYTGLFIWPVDQAPIYPLWSAPSLRLVGSVSAFIISIGIVLLFMIRRRIPPMTMFGLALAAVTLIPTLGFVPYGNMLVSYVSDHYMYLSAAGLAIALAAIVPERWSTPRRMRTVLSIGGTTMVTAAALASWQYLPVFRDARSVWNRTLAYNEASYPAHAGLARLEAAERDWDSAIYHLQRAAEIEPEQRGVRQLLGETYLKAGDLTKAKSVFASLRAEYPDWGDPLLVLARIAEFTRDFDLAIRLNEEAARLDPDNPAPYLALGRIFLGQLRREDAMDSFRHAIERTPGEAAAYLGLATCYRGLANHAGAVTVLERGLIRAPSDVALLNNLSRTLATSPDDSVRDGSRAVLLAQQANNATKSKSLDVLDTLAASYAEAGDFQSARNTIREAISLARERKQNLAFSVLESRLELYQAEQPLREKSFRPIPQAP